MSIHKNFANVSPLLSPNCVALFKAQWSAVSEVCEQTGLENVYCNDYYDCVESTLSVSTTDSIRFNLFHSWR